MKKRKHNSRPSNAGVDPRALEDAAAFLIRAIALAIKESQGSGYRRPRVGEQRRTRQPFLIDSMPEEVRVEIQKRRAAGDTWQQISEASAKFAGRTLPVSMLHRWYDVRVEQQPPDRCQPAPRQPEKRIGGRHIRPAPAPATREEAIRLAARLYTLGGACSELSLPLKISAAWLPLAEVGAFADRVEEHVRALVTIFDEYLATHPDALEQRGLRSTSDITRLDLEGARKQIGRLARIPDGSIGFDIGPHYLPPEFRPQGFVEKPYGDYDGDHDEGDSDEQ